MNRESMDIKEVWEMIKQWFNRKNLIQKIIWIIYLGLFIYEFFATPTNYQLFGFAIISLPIVLILDYLFGRFRHK